MTSAEFQTRLNQECQEVWDNRLKMESGEKITEEQFAQGTDDFTLEDLRQEVRLQVESLVELGLIKEEITP